MAARQAFPVAAMLVFGVFASSTTPARAQEESEEARSRLEVHGYLSQGFAVSDGHQVLGIPSGSGTFDYRTLAVQARSSFAERDAIVVQLSQQRLGRSPVMQSVHEVDVDWAFYEHEFGDGTRVRAGKVKVPFGVFNEIRFVGPLLPFFRPSEILYGEGSYTTETVNGAVVSHTFRAGEPWSVDVDAWAGEWTFLQQDFQSRARVTESFGGQLWLNTPWSGVRVGVGGYRGRVSDLLGTPPGTDTDHASWQVSLDANLPRFRFTTEFVHRTFEGTRYWAVNAQAGYQVLPRLTLNAQIAHSGLRADLPGLTFDADLTHEVAVSANFAIRPDLVLKAEHHWARGHLFESPEAGVDKPALNARYVILSVAAVF